MHRECFQPILSAHYTLVIAPLPSITLEGRANRNVLPHEQLRHRLGGVGEEIYPNECNTQQGLFPTGPPNVPLLSRLGDKSARPPNVCPFLLRAIPLYSRCPFHPVWPVVTLDVLRASLSKEAILNG